jgi:hypothetical protein
VIWNLVVGSHSYIHHIFPEKVCIAKVNKGNQFSLCIVVMNLYIMLQWFLLLFNITHLLQVYVKIPLCIYYNPCLSVYKMCMLTSTTYYLKHCFLLLKCGIAFHNFHYTPKLCHISEVHENVHNKYLPYKVSHDFL